MDVWNPPPASDAEIDALTTQFVGLVGVDVARTSRLLLEQLVYGRATKELDAFAVTDVLQELEGRSGGAGTKSAGQFKRLPLRGLWKAHFCQAKYIPRNLILEMQRKQSKAQVDEVFKRHSGKPVKDIIGELAVMFSTGSFTARSNRNALTGEWIVFAKDECGANLYLTLARHDEGDETIEARIRSRCEPHVLSKVVG